MTQLLWPARSRRYFQLDTPELDVSDELEEFSQATHVLLSEAGRAASPDRAPGRAQDQTGDQTQAPDQTQTEEPPIQTHTAVVQTSAAGAPLWPLPDVTRGAARAGPCRRPADSSVFSPVDADTERPLLPETAG